MSMYMKNISFPPKLIKSGFMANVKGWKEPGFGMLPHTFFEEPNLIHNRIAALIIFKRKT